MGMPALAIDFVRTPRRVNAIGLLLLLLAALLTAWVAADYLQAVEEQARLQLRASRALGAQPGRERDERVGMRSQQAQQALALLALPWEELFDGMAQAAARQQVGLLRLEADGAARTLRLTAQARNFTAARNFVEQLQRIAPVTAVSLSSHEAAADAGQPVLRFQVEVLWRASP